MLCDLFRVAVISKKFENEVDLTEPWYGTQYRLENIPPEVLKVLVHNLTLNKRYIQFFIDLEKGRIEWGAIFARKERFHSHKFRHIPPRRRRKFINYIIDHIYRRFLIGRTRNILE